MDLAVKAVEFLFPDTDNPLRLLAGVMAAVLVAIIFHTTFTVAYVAYLITVHEEMQMILSGC